VGLVIVLALQVHAVLLYSLFLSVLLNVLGIQAGHLTFRFEGFVFVSVSDIWRPNSCSEPFFFPSEVICVLPRLFCFLLISL